MIMTRTEDAVDLCTRLHQQLVSALRDASVVRERVETLLTRNPFKESCFCKGCVLPAVDSSATEFLASRFGASRYAIHRALRCEGFGTPLYTSDSTQVGFSSHSRSNSYHPGDKTSRRASSRRSPDFCIRLPPHFRMLGEVKYVQTVRSAAQEKLIAEMRDYLSIDFEPTSDWGHDFAFGLLYEYGGDETRVATTETKCWRSDRIFVSIFRRG